MRRTAYLIDLPDATPMRSCKNDAIGRINFKTNYVFDAASMVCGLIVPRGAVELETPTGGSLPEITNCNRVENIALILVF